MKLISNCAEWIDDDLLHFLDTSEKGKLISYTDEYKDHELTKLWMSKGYNLKSVSYSFFFPEDFDRDIELPNILSDAKEFWVSKLKPGDHIPYHYDIFKHPLDNVNRYWMALQDHQQGHIFIYKDKIFKDYKKGDIFQFDRANDWHGACNLGFSNKLTFQFTVIKNEN